MTTWKDGSHYGHLCQEITDEDNERIICAVWTKQFSLGSRNVEPYLQGEANFRLILKAPVMLEALEAIRDMTKPMLRSRLANIPATCAEWEAIRDRAIAAIAAVKGKDDETELV